jgi:hypothetical protein
MQSKSYLLRSLEVRQSWLLGRLDVRDKRRLDIRDKLMAGGWLEAAVSYNLPCSNLRPPPGKQQAYQLLRKSPTAQDADPVPMWRGSPLERRWLTCM